MSNTSSSASGGVGCLSLLGIAFIVMKLAEIGAVADWSWWWVLSPFIFQASLLILILLAVIILVVIKEWGD